MQISINISQDETKSDLAKQIAIRNIQQTKLKRLGSDNQTNVLKQLLERLNKPLDVRSRSEHIGGSV